MPKGLPIVSSTQENIDIEDITDDLILLRDGGAALILQTTAVNFGLLSETEQDATIYAYANLLNSLTFPVQIVIRSKRMDISSYLDLLKQQEEKQINENLRFQIKKYRQFVESIIKENEVLDKRFYIIIHFSPIELGVKPATSSLFSVLNPFAKRSKAGLPFPKSYIIERSRNNLCPKRDHIIRQLARIGLKAEQLTTQELVELFYDIYNPVQAGGGRLTAQASDYTVHLVTPATEEPLRPEEKPEEETGSTQLPPQPKITPPGEVSNVTRTVPPPPRKTDKLVKEKGVEKNEKTEEEKTLYQANQKQVKELAS